MNVRERMHERERAREWVKSLDHTQLGDLGDQPVLGDFDWRYWFHTKPSQVFMDEADYQRILREELGE